MTDRATEPGGVDGAPAREPGSPEWLDALRGVGEPLRLDGVQEVVAGSGQAWPGQAWLVVDGELALHLELRDERGSRTRLCRLTAGDLLPELPAAQMLTPDVRLVVSGEARLVEVPYEDLLERLSTTPRREVLSKLLASWLEGLASGVPVDGRPAHGRVELEAGEERLLLSGDSIAPRHGLLWVRVGEGVCRLLGRNELVSGTRALLPLTRSLWCSVATPEVRLAALPADELPAVEEIVSTTGTVLRGVVAITAAEIRRRLAADRARMAARSELDGRVLDGALRRLSRVVSGAAEGPEGSLVDTPLLAACRLVGRSLGLELRAPASGLAADAGIAEVGAIARASKTPMRRVRLRGEWWKQDNGPLLAFRAEDGRPVALTLTSSSSYALTDPSRPERSCSRVGAEEAATLQPRAVMFYPTFGDRPLGLASAFAAGLRGLAVDVRLVIVAGLVASVAGLVAPLSTQILFDEIIPRADRGLLPVMAMFLVLVPISSAFIGLVRSRAMLRIEGKMEMNFEAALMHRVLRLPASFFKKFLSGDLQLRLTAFTRIRAALSGTVLTSILSGIFSFTSLGLVLAYDSRLGLLGLVLGGISLGVILASSLISVGYNRKLRAVDGEIQGLMLQLFSSMAKLRVAAAERRAFAVWAHLFSGRSELSYRLGVITNNFAIFNAAFPLLTSMAMFYTVFLIGDPGGGVEGAAEAAGLSSGTFVAALAAFGQFLGGLLGLGSSVISVINIVPELERIQPIVEAVPEDHGEMTDPGALRGAVEVTHLSFRYDSDGPIVINDVSFEVGPGEMVAIVGPSGSGKSTLARLLLGLEAPESGTIYYDGEDLQSLDPGAVRSQIGTVLQGGMDIGGTIQEAILGGATDLSVEDAWEAARLAAVDEEIEALPMGMSTVLAENWTTFSGGQQQRMRLARALVRKPPVLILDEATSAVDNRAQDRIRSHLDALGTSRIVIAHRLSTIRHADRIYVLDGGRISDSGSYEELMERGGDFAIQAGRQTL